MDGYDLADACSIGPHVDSIKFSGGIVAGISLLSTRCLRLVHQEHKDCRLEVALSPRSFYILSGELRYEYTHEILGGLQSPEMIPATPSERRVSLIIRDVLPPDLTAGSSPA